MSNDPVTAARNDGYSEGWEAAKAATEPFLEAHARLEEQLLAEHNRITLMLEEVELHNQLRFGEKGTCPWCEEQPYSSDSKLLIRMYEALKEMVGA